MKRFSVPCLHPHCLHPWKGKGHTSCSALIAAGYLLMAFLMASCTLPDAAPGPAATPPAAMSPTPDISPTPTAAAAPDSAPTTVAANPSPATLPTPTAIAGTATPPGTPAPPIVEATPLGGFPVGIGTLRYRLATNIRDCSQATTPSGWPANFDPTASCALLPADAGGASMMTPGSFGQVWAWGVDRYGNRWGWFDRVGTLAAVACYNGVARADFYPGLDTLTFAGLIASGTLPAAVNPCRL